MHFEDGMTTGLDAFFPFLPFLSFLSFLSSLPFLSFLSILSLGEGEAPATYSTYLLRSTSYLEYFESTT